MQVVAMPKGDLAHVLKARLHPGETAVDVGSASGEMTRVMRKAVGPHGWVIAIEPRALENDWADEVRHVAIGSQASAMLHLSDDTIPGMASLHPRAMSFTRETGKISVAMKRLDDLVADAHLVKIDTQGHEIDVLQTAPRLLQTVPTWIVEVWPHGLWSAGHSVGDLWTLLTNAGLAIADVDGESVTAERAGLWLLGMNKHEKYTNWVASR